MSITLSNELLSLLLEKKHLVTNEDMKKLMSLCKHTYKIAMCGCEEWFAGMMGYNAVIVNERLCWIDDVEAFSDGGAYDIKDNPYMDT